MSPTGNGWPVEDGNECIINHLTNNGNGSCWYSTTLTLFDSVGWTHCNLLKDYGHFVYEMKNVPDAIFAHPTLAESLNNLFTTLEA